MRHVALAILGASVLAFAFASCVKREKSQPTATAPETKAPQIPKTPETGPFVVIGHLQHRDRIVTVKSGNQGPVYSVSTADGKTLFENLTAEQLKTESPEIYNVIDRANVRQAELLATEAPVLDGRIR
jgi:hypothetical protein